MAKVRRWNIREEKLRPGVAGLDFRHAKNFLIDHLKNFNLLRRGRHEKDVPDVDFWTSEEFWEKMFESTHNVLKWVVLNKFQIVDWFPRTPGLYHTRNAKFARKEANKFLREENGIKFYEPEGKTHMIDGGIGTVRFKTIDIDGEECWLCTATSDGYCNTGIPLAIPNYLMRSVNFYSNYRITGQIKFLPRFIEPYFHHMTKIPQIYLVVNALEQYGHNLSPAIISPMVFFLLKREARYSSEYSSVTYAFCRSDSNQDVDIAAEWLNDYAHRYGRGEIITNFDEQRPVFEDAPFSLQNVMKGRIKEHDLESFDFDNSEEICRTMKEILEEIKNTSRINVTLGDGSTIYGDIVVVGKIRDSFNKASAKDSPHVLKDLLREFAVNVGKMTQNLPKVKAEQVANSLETFTNEVTSQKPRRQWYKLSANNIEEAAQSISNSAVIENVSKLVLMLDDMPL